MSIFLVYLIFLSFSVAAAQDECLPTKCGDSGPLIRFPFRLKNRQAQHCGYPGFELSCSSSNETEFDLQITMPASTNNIIIPLSMKVVINFIDYEAQIFYTSDLNTKSCFPKKLPDVNSSTSQFDVVYFPRNYTFYNCSSYKSDSNFPPLITCLSEPGHRVYAFPSDYTVSSLPPSCYKMYNISNVPDEILNTPGRVTYQRRILMHWSDPSCEHCEAKDKYCRLKNNGTGNETECHNIPNQQHGHSASKKLVVAGIAVALFLTVL